MLVLSRKFGEKVIIGGEVTIQVLGIDGKKVHLGITAPKDISVHRSEVYDILNQPKETEAGDEQGK